MVESGGAVVCSHYSASDPPWLIPKCQGTRRQDRRLCSTVQSLEPPLYLDRNCRFHPRQNRPSLLTYFRDTRLKGDWRQALTSAGAGSGNRGVQSGFVSIQRSVRAALLPILCRGTKAFVKSRIQNRSFDLLEEKVALHEVVLPCDTILALSRLS